nr:hypothetical protein [Tanacetum cinerariifolium]
MEVGGKDRPPMLAPGSSETTTEGYTESYKNVSQDIRNQLDVEAESVQIILIGIDNYIYSTVDACPYACEMWKAIERLKQDGKSLESYYSRFYKMMNVLVRNKCDVTHHQVNVQSQPDAIRNKGKAIFNSPPPTYDQEPTMVAEDDEITSSNTNRAHQDNTLRINKGTEYDNQRVVNVAGPRENVDIQVVQQSRIQCYNCKEYGHVSRECHKPKRSKDAAYHKEEMLLLHYMYMAQIQEVTPDAADNNRPIFDTEPLQKVQNDNDNYNVFSIDKEHLEQPELVNETYLEETSDTNITFDSLDMSTNGVTVNQDDDDLSKECDLLASLIEKLKCEIDDSKNRNKVLESSNKALVDKLKAIPTTSVSRPQFKSNRLEDRVIHNKSERKKQQVEDHRRNFKFSNYKTSITACNHSLNAKTSNVNFVYVSCGKYVLNDNHDMCALYYINGVNSWIKIPMAVPISTREPKRTMNQSAATPLKSTVTVESTNQGPRSTIRKQYKQISKICKWWYCKITPP